MMLYGVFTVVTLVGIRHMTRLNEEELMVIDIGDLWLYK